VIPSRQLGEFAAAGYEQGVGYPISDVVRATAWDVAQGCQQFDDVQRFRLLWGDRPTRLLCTNAAGSRWVVAR
jgi:hypothetical protein